MSSSSNVVPPRPGRARISRRLFLLGFLGAFVLFLTDGCSHPISLAPLERQLIFHPMPHPKGNWQPPVTAIEDAWFTGKDGTRIHGWFIDHPSPRAVVLFTHGNAGNITLHANRLRVLNEQFGLSVLVFDYRGYGKSEGSPSEQNILSDARAARRWLAKRTGISERDVVLMGRSLGGAVAVDLAAKDGARGLILESTFTSLPDVGAYHYPWLPVRSLMHHQLNSLGKIKLYRGPLLISHGDADEVVPFEQGKRLYDAAPGQKEFVRMAGGTHNSPQSDDYLRALERFISELP